MQTKYTTEDGYKLVLGRVSRRALDRIGIEREPPQPPTRTVEAWGDIEEEIPILDDHSYQTALMQYHLWLAMEQASILVEAMTIPDDVDWSELFELGEVGVTVADARVGFLRYLLSDRDRSAVIERILYQSTVTAQGIAEAERAYAVTWLGKPVTAWRVPTVPAMMSWEFEARRAAQVYGHNWSEFCWLTGPEQSAIVAHYRLSNKLAYLEAEYDRERRKHKRART